jgi:hypothetical protein
VTTDGVRTQAVKNRRKAAKIKARNFLYMRIPSGRKAEDPGNVKGLLFRVLTTGSKILKYYNLSKNHCQGFFQAGGQNGFSKGQGPFQEVPGRRSRG